MLCLFFDIEQGCTSKQCLSEKSAYMEQRAGHEHGAESSKLSARLVAVIGRADGQRAVPVCGAPESRGKQRQGVTAYRGRPAATLVRSERRGQQGGRGHAAQRRSQATIGIGPQCALQPIVFLLLQLIPAGLGATDLAKTNNE